MRVLTVDDDEMALAMLNLSLEQAGYEVSSASDGRQALEMHRRNPCRIIIADWEMPEMSGVELIKAIRSDTSSCGYVYMILLTCHANSSQVVQGLDSGADDYVAKPFNPAELVGRVRVGERIIALETRDAAIFAMAKLAESRDPETGAHLDRVRNYSRLLAETLTRLGSPGYVTDVTFARNIYLTSPLHDIGKVGIPDSVLLKPARLSDREFEIMKTHTTIGADTLNAALAEYPNADFLQMARDIALSHHERFDGTGYPGGLVGRNIPLSGRIVALADVYDALTSRRTYKNAFGHEVSKSILFEESGTHFDPEVVSAFIEAEEGFIEIRQRFLELEPAVA